MARLLDRQGRARRVAAEKPAGPLELRVYPGGNGDFTLYEDEGDGYAYENGGFATVPLHWDEQKRTLTIGPRAGIYPGMPATRTFRVVLVREGHGIGIGPSAEADHIVTYSGQSVSVALQ